MMSLLSAYHRYKVKNNSLSSSHITVVPVLVRWEMGRSANLVRAVASSSVSWGRGWIGPSRQTLH